MSASLGLGFLGCAAPAHDAGEDVSASQTDASSSSRVIELRELDPPPGLPADRLIPVQGEAEALAFTPLAAIRPRLTLPAWWPESQGKATQAATQPDVEWSIPETNLATERAFGQARVAYLEGRRFEAARLLLQANRLTPNHPSILRMLGLVYTENGNPVRGAVYLNETVQLDPSDVTSLYLLARHAVTRELWGPGAAAMFELIELADDENDTSRAMPILARFYLASALQQLGYLEASAKVFEEYLRSERRLTGTDLLTRELITLDRQRSVTIQQLGDLYHRLNQPVKALAIYRNAGRNDLAYAQRLIYSALRTSQDDAAQTIVLDVLKQAKAERFSEVLPLVRYVAKHTKQPLAFAEQLRAAFPEQAPPDALWIALADLLPPADAAALLEDKLEARLTPGSKPETWRPLLDQLLAVQLSRPHDGQSLTRQQHDEALRWTLRALAVQPSQPELAVRTLLDRADPKLLEQALEAQIQTASRASAQESVWSRALPVMVRGLWHEHQNRLGEAETDYRAALEEDGSLLWPRLRLAEAALLDGEAVKAEQWLEPASAQGDLRVTTLRARALGQRGFRTEAVALLEPLPMAREAIEPLLIKAKLLVDLDRPDDAEAALLQALDINPKHEPTYVALFELYDNHEPLKPKQADLFNRLQKELPRARATRLIQARALLSRRQFAQATALLQPLVRNNPEDTEVLRLLLAIAILTQDHKVTETLLDRLLTLEPDDQGLIGEAMRYYQRQDQTQKALALQARWLELQPAEAQWRAGLAQAYRLLKRYDDAIATATEALDLEDAVGHVPTLVSEARRSFLAAGRGDEAIDWIREVRGRPSFAVHRADLGYALALTLDRLERRDDAEQALIENLREHPLHPGSNNSLAYRYAFDGRNLAAAETMLDNALSVEPNNPAYLDSLGWVYFKQGRFDEAKVKVAEALEQTGQLIDRGLDLADTQAILRDHLADIHWAQGERDEAIRLWEQVVAMDLEGYDLTEDPELESLAARLKAKLDAVEAGEEPPVAHVPGDAGAGLPLQELLRP